MLTIYEIRPDGYLGSSKVLQTNDAVPSGWTRTEPPPLDAGEYAVMRAGWEVTTLPPSDSVVLSESRANRIARIKAEAYDRIRALEGDATDPLWKRRRAEDRAALGDDTELTALRQAIEAVRQASNQAEADVMAFDDVAAINGFSW